MTREANRWYVSLTVEVERPDPIPVQGDPVGIDLGLLSFAVLSDGSRIESPRPLKQLLRKQWRLSRAHSRKKKGSASRRKSARNLARLYRRIRNIRTDFLHKTTTKLARTKPVIVVEDLAVRNMMRNRHLARSIADSGWGAVRRMLAYKTVWDGSRLVMVPKFHPSAKTCSGCGTVKESLPLKERTFRCEVCGRVIRPGCERGQESGEVGQAANNTGILSGCSRRREFPGDGKRLWSGPKTRLAGRAATKQES